MRYDAYRYLWPPRPEQAISPGTLRQWEKAGWWAQAKMNGTCCTLYVAPDSTTIQRSRHGDDAPIKRWHPGENWDAFARTLPGSGWYVFVGELLHLRGVGVKDTIYLFDLLVADGEYLIGKTYAERLSMLRKLCDHAGAAVAMTATHRIVWPGIWLAEVHAHSFREWFDAAAPVLAADNCIEGLVLKNPNAPLQLCTKQTANADWQMKCRRSTNHLTS